MAKGSEQPVWAWTNGTKTCDTCGNTLRIKDVALFYGITERFIRCFDCVNAKRAAFIQKTRREMGMTT